MPLGALLGGCVLMSQRRFEGCTGRLQRRSRSRLARPAEGPADVARRLGNQARETVERTQRLAKDVVEAMAFRGLLSALRRPVGRHGP